MILVDNREILKKRSRGLLEKLADYRGCPINVEVVVEQSKAGTPTLKVNSSGVIQYLHSKYDPEKEADRLITQLEGVEKVKHVLFVGCGLGYHISRFLKQYPKIKFSIYEPSEEVLVSYLSHKNLNDLPLRNLVSIFTGTNEIELQQELASLLQSSNGQIYIYTLPVYKTLYDAPLKLIMEKALEALKYKQNNLLAKLAFQKRWTVNAIKNFPTVLKTPNILRDIDKSVFAGKPAILVAAGPSLNMEFENLRYIKERGLAYIFSVGSAINALIEHGVYPDAACTYDPQDINYKVIQIIKDKGISNIPLIYGTSVGYETLEEYPGHMLHMLVSQDTITPAFLGKKLVTDLEYVNDAPSIAVVTYQLLSSLGCEKIILVGQNLAYIGTDHYASGIDYGSGTRAGEEQLAKALITEDVYGNKVKTSDSFNMMRHQLELYINRSPHITTINTTKGGASIEGTKFQPLEQIINEELVKSVVLDKWYAVNNSYAIEKVNKNIASIDKEQSNLEKLLKRSIVILEELNRHIEKRTFGNIERIYGEFDASFERIKANYFYRSFIEPMLQVQNEQLAEQAGSVRYERNQQRKGEVVVNAFYNFLNEISTHYYFSTELYEEMKEKIKK